MVVNTILWGNTAADGPAIYRYSGMVTLKNCALPTAGVHIVTGTVTSEDCVSAAPRLQACDADGNFTTVSTDIRWYRLRRGSSAIGAGLPVGEHPVDSVTVTVLSTDQLGNPRPGPGGPGENVSVDIGAWEYDGMDPEPEQNPNPNVPAPTDRSGATVSPVSGGMVSGDQLLVNIPSDAPGTSGGSITVTLRVTGWKDSRGNPVTPYEIRMFVGGVLREETRVPSMASAGGVVRGVRGVTDTVTFTLTSADLDKLVEVRGHIAGDQWITSQAFTVTQSDTILPSLPTPEPDPAGPSDPTPSPTPDPIPADPTTPDSGESSGGGRCQAASFAQGLLALAARGAPEEKVMQHKTAAPAHAEAGVCYGLLTAQGKGARGQKPGGNDSRDRQSAAHYSAFTNFSMASMALMSVSWD